MIGAEPDLNTDTLSTIHNLNPQRQHAMEKRSAVNVENVSKVYKLYRNKADMVKEALHPFKKKYHKPFYALENINLNLCQGEILGIVGKNGSGKSTLLKIISGVLPPTKGAVRIKGEVIALLELGAGFNPNFSGRENIFFYGSIMGYKRGDIIEKINDIIAFADIGEYIDQPVKTYSTGMKARLGFAVTTHIRFNLNY